MTMTMNDYDAMTNDDNSYNTTSPFYCNGAHTRTHTQGTTTFETTGSKVKCCDLKNKIKIEQ